MCNDGVRLYGRSTAVSSWNNTPRAPSTAGRSKVKRCGHKTKHATDKSTTVTSRAVWQFSSARLRQTKNEATKKANNDPYGMIVQSIKGMARSHANTTAPTSARMLVI